MCSACVTSHFLQDTDALHRPFPVDAVEGSGNKDMCGVCRVETATQICTCLYPWIPYCPECAAVHASLETGQSKHSLEPLRAREFLHTASDLADFYERQRFVEELETELERNRGKVVTCIAQVNTLAQEIIGSIEGWRGNVVKLLEEIQEKLCINVEAGRSQLESLRYLRTISPTTRLEQLLLLCTRDTLPVLKTELNMLNFTLDPDRLLAQIPYIAKCSENYLVLEEINKLFFVVPRSNRMITVDLPDLIPRESVLNTDFKFKSASAWCKLPTGEVLLCGGVRQYKGATYYKEVVSIDPSTLKVRPLPSMHTPRCRHCVLHYKNSVFVFGGYNDKLLKSCEQYDLQDNQWTQLPDLKEGMDCVTACIWRDKAYIVGYGCNRVEVFDFTSSQMSILQTPFRPSLVNMLLPKHSALLTICNSDLVILMEADLVRVNIDSLALRSEPNKPQRNWYTPCAPCPLRNEELLFFTLDQEMWRLRLPTGDLQLLFTVK